MSDCFIGQIMMTGFGFAPQYFARCDGQILSIQQNQALFSLLGTYYGGDGMSSFALPDLRGRTPVGGGFASQDAAWAPPPYVLGQVGGTEATNLGMYQLPVHTHVPTVVTLNPGSARPPRTLGLTLGSANDATKTPYGAPDATVPLAAGPLGAAGGDQPHNNIQPYQAINFNIAMYGVFPSRN